MGYLVDAVRSRFDCIFTAAACETNCTMIVTAGFLEVNGIAIACLAFILP